MSSLLHLCTLPELALVCEIWGRGRWRNVQGLLHSENLLVHSIVKVDISFEGHFSENSENPTSLPLVLVQLFCYLSYSLYFTLHQTTLYLSVLSMGLINRDLKVFERFVV